MAQTFTPPDRGNRVPTVLPTTPERQRSPWQFFAPTIARPVNVFLLVDGTFTETQPRDSSTIAHTYHGGHVHSVSDSEAAALTAAGYTVVASGAFGDGLFGDGYFGGPA